MLMNLCKLLFIFSGIVQSSSPFHSYDAGSSDCHGGCVIALKDELFEIYSSD